MFDQLPGQQSLNIETLIKTRPDEMIVDIAGMARFVHDGQLMADIAEKPEILALLDRLNA